MLTLPLILAAISAGLIGGFHCIGMCGGIAQMLGQLPQLSDATNSIRKTIPILPASDGERISVGQFPAPQNYPGEEVVAKFLSSSKATPDFIYHFLLHSGRLSTYMIVGAIFGGLGALSLRWKTNLPIGSSLFLIGNFALILLALRLLGVRLQTIIPTWLSEKIQMAYRVLMPAMKKGSKHPYLMGMTWGALPCGLSYAIAPFALLSGQAWSGAVLMLIFGLTALPHLLITQSFSQNIKQRGWIRITQVLLALILLGVGLMGIVYVDMNNMPDFLCITPKY